MAENKGGGSTTIATGAVAKAAPDGYTLLANEMTQTIIPWLFPKLSFDPIKDLLPVTVFAEAPYVLVVNSGVPAKSLRELVDWRRRSRASSTSPRAAPAAARTSPVNCSRPSRVWT